MLLIIENMDPVAVVDLANYHKISMTIVYHQILTQRARVY